VQRDSGSERGELINTHIVDGTIVPVEVTVNLLKDEMEQQGWTRFKYLIDGFPRNFDNKQGWDRVMHSIANVPAAIFIECSESKMIERI
jgi:UMP-CMP kinase